MDTLNHQSIYALQDDVLDIVFKTENIFYLTGGTCINRFYHEKRFSDDLDFFTHNSSRYSFAVRNIKSALKEKFTVDPEVEEKDFSRLKIQNILKIDFVNDIPYRYKDVIITERGYAIDNIENILCNKLTAIIGRDNPKDIFDVYVIWKYHSFSWKEILHAAHKKAVFSDDELIARLKTFPKGLLDNLKILDTSFLNNFDNDFTRIIEELSICVLQSE